MMNSIWKCEQFCVLIVCVCFSLSLLQSNNNSKNDFRRKWDKDEYEQMAQRRLDEERDKKDGKLIPLILGINLNQYENSLLSFISYKAWAEEAIHTPTVSLFKSSHWLVISPALETCSVEPDLTWGLLWCSLRETGAPSQAGTPAPPRLQGGSGVQAGEDHRHHQDHATGGDGRVLQPDLFIRFLLFSGTYHCI